MEDMKMESDIDGYWDGDNFHLTVLLPSDKRILWDKHNDDWIKLKEVIINREEMDKIKEGESIGDLLVRGSKVFIKMETDDDRLYESQTDVGIKINDLIYLSEQKTQKLQNPRLSYPVDDKRWEMAIKNAENFNMSPPDSTYKMKIDLPVNGEPMAQIGKVAGIIYTSDKEGLGDDQQYIHEMKKPYPTLALAGTNKSPIYIIFGGKTYISEPGDNSGEAPGWMID